MQTTSVYRFNSDYTLLEKIPLTVSVNECNNKVNVEIKDSGAYVARNEGSYTVLIVCLILSIGLILIGSAIGIYMCRNPKYCERIRYTLFNAKRSVSNQI
jgi:hypothetical protein